MPSKPRRRAARTIRAGAAAAALTALAGLAVWVLLWPPGAPAAEIALERLLGEATLHRPVQLVEVPDGSGRLAVVEQPGRVKTFRPGDARPRATVLDLRGRVSTRHNEEGLLSIAFHPDFADNREVYAYYSAAGPRRSVVARFTWPAGAPAIDAGSRAVLLEVPQPYGNHNGGLLRFGPDGYLYIGLGDGGAGGDPMGNGQDPGTLLGAILRIDVDRASGDRAYAIPAGNPFAGGGGRPEVFAYGLRNPWRFSFDRKTGALYAGDVGQNRIEEIDRVVKGGNYGWNRMEGTSCYAPASGCRTGSLLLPIAEYGRRRGLSVTGGHVYRGQALPGLQGRYVFGDYGSGRIWSIPARPDGVAEPEPLLASGLSIASFGADARGELYVVDHGGGIYRIVPAD